MVIETAQFRGLSSSHDHLDFRWVAHTDVRRLVKSDLHGWGNPRFVLLRSSARRLPYACISG